MKQEFFDEAQKAYSLGDYETALKGFLLSMEGDETPNCKVCQMAGNCLMRLRRPAEAVALYRKALLDPNCGDEKGTLFNNLGTALAAAGNYSEAIDELSNAIETGYTGAYRAYAGLGNAYMKLGNIEEAGISYRKAALFDGNPDPGKSLVNLGICFMMLGRPDDAAEAYKAALSFPSYKSPGKALANLGQAYVAAGRMPDAVDSFQKATQNYGQALSPAAQADYNKALKVTGGAIHASDVAPGMFTSASALEPDAETVEQITAVSEQAHVHGQTGIIPPVDEEVATKFFDTTEEDIRKSAREARKEQRRENRTWLHVFIGVVVVLILLLGAIAGAYFLGFGYPSQNATIDSMMSAYANGDDVSDYWVAHPNVDVVREMLTVPQTSDVEIDSLDKGATESTAIITAKLESGATLDYTVTLQREALGWKVSGIESYFPSSNQ